MSDDTANDLRKFLKRHPQPAVVLAYKAEDDEPRTIRVGATKSKWRDAQEACDAYPILEACSEDGAVLRKYVRADVASLAKKEPEGFDPESARLQHFATLLSEAHASVYKAFELQSMLIQTLANRNAELEKAWQKLLNAQAAALGTPDIDEGDLSDKLVALLPAVLPLLQATKPLEPEQPSANGKK